MIDPRSVKILIGTPVLADPKFNFVASMVTYWGEHKYPSQIRFIHETYIHTARNRLVYQAVEQKATHLMFIDSDIMFPKWGIDRLVDLEKDIVGGLYFGRGIPRPVALNIDPKDKQTKVLRRDEIKEIPFEVDAVGTGFMLVNMDVFKQMMPPFFFHTELENFGLATRPFPFNELGEDVAFCLKAKEHGLKVWVDPTIPLGHTGEKVYTRTDYDIFENEETRKIYETAGEIK